MKDYFDSTAEYYVKYRPYYPEVVLQKIISDLSITSEKNVIDLGSGPGLLAIQLAKYAKCVVALEPNPEMVLAGRRLVNEKEVDNVTWLQASAEEPGDITKFRKFQAATFGASFHWMNQHKVLSWLNEVVVGDGGIAVAGSQSIWIPTEKWEEEVKLLVQKYLGKERRAGTGKHKVSARTDEAYADIFAKSAFSDFYEEEYLISVEKKLDQVVGRLYSSSFANPKVLGERFEGFDQELRSRLMNVNPSGVFRKNEKYYLLIAKRPA